MKSLLEATTNLAEMLTQRDTCQRCGIKELQSNLTPTVLYPDGLCQDCLDD